MSFSHLQSLLNSFRCAVRGLLLCLKTQRNFRLELIIALWVTAGALALELSRVETAILLLCCALVLSAELLNTAVELAVDLCCQKPHPLAGAAKDAAAGGVLLAAFIAAVIGVLTFGCQGRPKALAALIFSSPARILPLAGAAVLSALFVFLPCSKQVRKHP